LARLDVTLPEVVIDEASGLGLVNAETNGCRS